MVYIGIVWGCSANGNTLVLQSSIQGSIPCSSTIIVKGITMSKNEAVIGIYSVESRVRVNDSRHMYNGLEGIVERLGSAGNLIYYHVRLRGVFTPITLTSTQLTPIGA